MSLSLPYAPRTAQIGFTVEAGQFCKRRSQAGDPDTPGVRVPQRSDNRIEVETADLGLIDHIHFLSGICRISGRIMTMPQELA